MQFLSKFVRLTFCQRSWRFSSTRKAVGILLLTTLSSCDHFDEERANEFQSLSQLQQAHYWQAKKVDALIDQVKGMGVTIYVVGDEYQILIPANRIFKDNTPQLSSNPDALMKAIATLINAQSTPSVRVLTYANNSNSTQRNFSLTQSWADTIVDHLRQQGLTVALLSGQGHGQCDNIGTNNLYTNRIEIRYRIDHEN